MFTCYLLFAIWWRFTIPMPCLHPLKITILKAIGSKLNSSLVTRLQKGQFPFCSDLKDLNMTSYMIDIVLYWFRFVHFFQSFALNTSSLIPLKLTPKHRRWLELFNITWRRVFGDRSGVSMDRHGGWFHGLWWRYQRTFWAVKKMKPHLFGGQLPQGRI